jgi:galactonate dehydratase
MRAGIVLCTAISAIEIALWDILGKVLGAPIWKLLGGKVRDRVRVYQHARLERNGQSVRLYEHGTDPQLVAEAFLARKEEGWTACKGRFITTDEGIIDPVASVEEGIRTLKTVREAVGEHFDIAIDLHGFMTAEMASRFCRRAVEYRPLFIEEPVSPEDHDGLVRLRRESSVALATGERLSTTFAFRDLCASRLVDYVQPDVIHCGGIAEMKKIGSLAETFGIQMAPHNPASEVSTLASIHVNLATPNATILEIGSGSADFRSPLFSGGAVEFKDGYALPPTRPGLGIELDEAVARKSPYLDRPWNFVRYPDGSPSIH